MALPVAETPGTGENPGGNRRRQRRQGHVLRMVRQIGTQTGFRCLKRSDEMTMKYLLPDAIAHSLLDTLGGGALNSSGTAQPVVVKHASGERREPAAGQAAFNPKELGWTRS